MTNNDILCRIRYAFNFKEATLLSIFSQAEHAVTAEQLNAWLKDETEKGFKTLSDTMLATFLNGFINFKRGKKEGEQPKPETALTNNMIFMKLRIALNLKADDVLNMLELMGVELASHELGAFFRKAGHKNYRHCPDEMLIHFLTGLQRQHRPDQPDFDEISAAN